MCWFPPVNDPTFARLARDRRSVRAFTSDDVPLESVRDILAIARTAPSGANLQPGKFIVLAGEPLDDFRNGLSTVIENGLEPSEQYSYFPEPMPKYLRQRQVRLGADLYEALGIDRKDPNARQQYFLRNYRFFDAPMGIIATIDRRMGKGCYMDFGMMLQTLFLAARAEGLATCGIGALAEYGPFIAERLELDEHDIVVCGIALGYEDVEAPVNRLRTDRLDVDQFSRFEGWS